MGLGLWLLDLSVFEYGEVVHYDQDHVAEEIAYLMMARKQDRKNQSLNVTCKGILPVT